MAKSSKSPLSSSINSQLFPTDRVTDFSIGLNNVKDAAEKALYNLKDENSGDIIQNSLCLNMVPRYMYKISDNSIQRVNPGTSLGDIISSLVHISSRLELLEKEVELIKKRQDRVDITMKTDEDEIEHMGQHISAMENNLRCLRQTLTYGTFEEEDLPELEHCPLAGDSDQKKKTAESADNVK